MTSNRDRRSLLNPKLDRRARMRMLMPFAILIGAILVIGISMDNVISAISAEFTNLLSGQGPDVMIKFGALIAKVKSVMVIELGFISVLALILWAFYSYRIFGPQVAILRQVQALIDRDYKARIHLRRYDEFSELAEQLNRLAKTLEEREQR